MGRYPSHILWENEYGGVVYNLLREAHYHLYTWANGQAQNCYLATKTAVSELEPLW